MGVCRDPHTNGEPPILQPARLVSMTRGKVHLIERVIGIFAADAPQQVDELEAAIALGKPEPIVGVAHKLKGAAGDVGAVRLWDAASACEEAAKRGDVAECRSLTQRVRELLEPSLDALRTCDWSQYEPSS